MKILETERLILRTWKEKDLKLMAAINQDPMVMEHFPNLQDLDTTKNLIEHIGSHQDKHGFSLYAVEIKQSKKFIGFVGLNVPYFEIPDFQPSSLPIVEIGWRLASEHWGQGYAFEVATSVLDYAFNKLNLYEIISFTAASNIKSINLMKKIGLLHNSNFTHPKLDEYSPLRQHVLYKLTKDEYFKGKHY